jgi:hypothetical protein
MGRRKNRSRYEYNHTPTTLLLALLGGSCAFIAVETTRPDILDVWGSQVNKFPEWLFHMGSACSGIMTFFSFLFLLELVETRSRITAWRSTAPWLVFVGLTSFATIIHTPYYILIMTGTICGVWAYRQTSGVRRSPMGHRTLRMTFRYAHLAAGHLPEVVEKIVPARRPLYGE